MSMMTNTSDEMESTVMDALRECVRHTPYSIYQYMRVIELASKHGDKVEYYLTKKQKMMWSNLATYIKGIEMIKEMMKK